MLLIILINACGKLLKIEINFQEYNTSMRIQTTFIAIILSVAVAQADWPSWRGPDDRGSTVNGDYPSKLSQQSTLWKAPLPGKGCSTPIIVDKKIYVTAPVRGKDGLLALNWNGEPVWKATFGKESPGKHRNGSGCNASPTSDGKAIFAYFKSGTLAAVELDGKVRWQTNLVERFGKVNLFWDHGTSPVLTENQVVFARMHKGDSWLAAFDKKSGDIVWKVDRNYEVPVECDHGYTTPIVVRHNGKEAILVWGAEHLTIHDAASGEVVWTCANFNRDSNKLWPAVATPVISNGMAVVAFGRNDKGSPLLFGVDLGGSGDVTETNHRWLRTDVSTFVPSPVAYQNKVYLVRDRGEVECIDPKTGSNIWSDRFPKARKNFYSSPTIAGGKLYAAREDGVVFVASVDNDEFKLLSENDFGEPVIGSPVPLENRIFIRGEKFLYCLSD